MAITNNKLTTEQYNENFKDIHPPFENKTAALIEASRCIFCYDAPCTKVCPTHIDVPKFIKQISTENIKGSAHTILSSNILGAGCSKVCPVEKLCEGSCVYNLLKEEPIQIARLQRYSTEIAIQNNWQLFEKKNNFTNKKIAIVGAGPAGLSCAHSLAKEGVEVTIYEKEKKGGGLMTYGIAAYKVTPQFCEAELKYILSIGGITIKYEHELGKNISLTDLQKNYDAVYLAFGVGVARQLNIEGEDLDGVVDAIEFIYNLRNNDFNKINIGDNVAVIGMGMTAIDAATQAKRLGAKNVTMLYRRTKNEMPCTQHELDIAMLDGCKIVWLTSPKEIIGTNGKVTQLVCNKMILAEPDLTGRRTTIETGETFTIDVDMVIKAAGQTPFEKMINEIGFANKDGKIIIDENNATNVNGVFAGGDNVNGGKEVVDAVQAGKNGAAKILEYFAK